jgi:hypothetical protein
MSPEKKESSVILKEGLNPPETQDTSVAVKHEQNILDQYTEEHLETPALETKGDEV